MGKTDNKSSSVKKSVSFRPDVFEEAERMADKYFGGNFSAYITYLICADKYGLARSQQTEEVAVKREEIKQKTSEFQASAENESYINEILNM